MSAAHHPNNRATSAAKPFEHYCHCGAWGSFGFGRFGASDGEWFCLAHMPAPERALHEARRAKV